MSSKKDNRVIEHVRTLREDIARRSELRHRGNVGSQNRSNPKVVVTDCIHARNKGQTIFGDALQHQHSREQCDDELKQRTGLNLSEEVTPSAWEKYIKFGMSVQVICPDVVVEKFESPPGLALSTDVDIDNKHDVQPEAGSFVIASRLLSPNSWNCFYILSERGTHERDGEVLHYRQTFTLSPNRKEKKEPLYLEASFPWLGSGVSPLSNTLITLSDKCNFHCLWKAQSVEHRLQRVMEEPSILPFCSMYLLNQSSYKYLTAEISSSYSTDFGQVCHATMVHRNYDYGCGKKESFWIFSIQQTGLPNVV